MDFYKIHFQFETGKKIRRCSKTQKPAKLHKIDDFFTIKTPPGYPWVSRGQLKSLEPNLRGPELDHQVLRRLDANNLSKIAMGTLGAS